MGCSLQFIWIIWTAKKPHTILNSYLDKKTSVWFFMMHLFNFVDVIWLLIRIPPPFLFWSGLNGVQKTFIKNWEAGKKLSSFVSVIVERFISFVTIFLSKSNLFQIEFMFKWPVMISYRWFKCRYLRGGPGEFLSISKLVIKGNGVWYF